MSASRSVSAAPLVFHLVPHTHWDREWYLPRAAFLARLVALLDDLVARLEREPDYRAFLLDGQTVHVEDYLRVRPAMRERLRALVRDGRLQVGPWYVLADEQIPAAESLLRNLLLGAADAAALGRRLEVLYSPDAFGHPAAWPALAAEFGIGYGALWRGLGTAPGQGDLVRWRAADGAEVLVYHLPPDGYEVGAALPADPARLARAWPPLRDGLVARASTRHVVVLVGADHHAAHPDVPALRDALAALEAGRGTGAEVRVSRLDDALRAAAVEHPRVPVLAGELRWSYGYTWTLQGVHGTRAHLKRRNAAAELALERWAEPLAALAAHLRRPGGTDRRDLLAHAWRALVRTHFHDTLGGCASDAVALAAERRLADVEAYAREVARAGVFELAGHDADAVREGAADGPALLLWNPAARGRAGIVVADVSWFRRDVFVGPPGGRVPRTAPPAPAFGLRDAEGRVVPVQVLGRRDALERRDAPRHYPDLDAVEVVRVAFRAPAVGGLALARLTPDTVGAEPVLAAQDAVRVHGRTLANDLVEVTVARDGTLELRDRRSGERYPGLLGAELGGDVGDTYTFAAPADDRPARMSGPVAVRALAEGPLVGALAVEGAIASARGSVALRVTVQLQAGSPLVRVTLELDNAARDARLRLRFPTGLAGVAARAGAQFGAVTRPPVAVSPADYPRETPVATTPAHRFVAAARAGRGLALLAPGFFEYEWTRAGELLFTVFRAVGELSKADLPTRPGHAGWAMPTPLAQCPGPDRLQLALLPAGAPPAFEDAGLLSAWEDAFLPLRPLWLRETTMGTLPASGIELAGEGLVFSALKPAEHGDALVLRCWNASDRAVEGAWHFPAPVGRAARTRADETELAPLPLADGGRTVPFIAAPHAIVTVRVEG
ncbi:MAG TPA: glycoside hydrolase family 38 C-terminal domain-containing protein [Gemmatimonadales bacterium]|nr:glycoside hydrolase family 38 C-terminal domain-containing protein [Gemmatimonadales bacterium]